MTTDNDVAKLSAAGGELEFAARSFREAANVKRAQRDEARPEASALRHRIRIAALVMAVTVLLVVEAVASESTIWYVVVRPKRPRIVYGKDGHLTQAR